MDQKIISTVSRLFVLIALVSLFLGACSLPSADGSQVTSNSGVSVWLDQSPDGWTLPLAPFTFKAHASAPNGGITSIAFLVSNGDGAAVNVGSVTTDPGQPLAYGELIWNPAAPGEYSIQAQAFSSNGSQLSQIAQICVAADAGISPSHDGALCSSSVAPAPQQNITITPTIDVPTITPIPPGYILTVVKDANCRKGPDIAFDVVNSVLTGQQVQVIGRNAESTWWYSQLAADKCWVSNVAGIPTGDLTLLAVVQSPPTPIPTETEIIIVDPDDDGDGYPFSNDCNDKDPKINPGMAETMDDKVDSNCNGDDNK